MKAYNTPKDELLIKSDEGEELVKITPEKTTISNLEDSGNKRITIDLPGEKFFQMLAGLSPTFIIPDSETADIDSEILENVEILVNTEVTPAGTQLQVPVSGLARFGFKGNNKVTWAFSFILPTDPGVLKFASFTRDTNSETHNEIVCSLLNFSATSAS